MGLGPLDENAATFGAGIPLPIVVWVKDIFALGVSLVVLLFQHREGND
jgi:hypothetical protein